MVEFDNSQGIVPSDTEIGISSDETTLSKEQAALIHSRYLGLLKTYGVLEREENLRPDGSISVFTERKCPVVQKDIESTMKDPLKMGMTIRLHTWGTDRPFEKGEQLPTDVPDDVGVRLAINVRPRNIFVYNDTKRISFIINPNEVQHSTWEEDTLVELGILEGGSSMFTKLQSIASILEEEYKQQQIPKNRQPPEQKP